MYPVNNRLHTLAFEENVKTRIRVYFISDSVDCTDDSDVQTNGTLLVGAAGDTDSNGRISFDQGVTFNEYFNPDKNIQIGAAVSSNVTMTMLNYDGALDGFSYGRCKIYLDAYDDENSVWLPCPMGVYIIDIPVKRKTKLVNAIGYDQMQKFDGICDAWWSSLNWSGGITLSQLLTSLATQIGVSVSSNTASAIVNGTVSFTEEPFQCNEVTYREVLEYIAEATGTVARFDRNGALDLRWFAAAQISGNTVTVNTDTVGNQCLAISVAEYSVAAVDLLKVKLYTDDIGITVGTGTNQYTIVNNLFLDGANSSAIIAKATPIYNRLHGLDAYSPVSARIITDWSIEAGDIINIVNDSITYSVPIFQQSMAWRGGYVVSDFLSDGDNVRPVLDYDERTYYRLNSEMSKKVGDNEIISKINQTAEQIQIQASKVNLTGYITATNLATAGQTVINGDNITTGTLKAITIQDTGTNPSNYWDLSNGNFVATNGSVGGFTLSDSGLSYGSISPEGSGIGFALKNGSISYVTESGSERYITSITGSGLGFGDNTNATPGVWKWRTGLNHGNRYVDGAYRDRFSISRLNPPNYTTSSSIVDFTDNGTNFYTIFEGDVETRGNATVNGVLDVTQRRCYASLSSGGWYRVLTFAATSNAYARGCTGNEIVFHITRRRINAGEETHDIKMLCGYDDIRFVDETSSSLSGYQRIDKIRYNYNGSYGYVDIHATAAAAYVTVDFDVYCEPSYQALYTANALESVAESPGPETELTRYTFAANTSDSTSPTLGEYGTSFEGGGYVRKINGIVYLRVNVTVKDTPAGGWRSLFTIPTGFNPSIKHEFFAMDNSSDAAIHARVYANGTVSIWPNSAIPSGRLINCYVIFPSM